MIDNNTYYLEEDGAGNIVIHGAGTETLFNGEEALANALLWANQQGLSLYSNINPTDLIDQSGMYGIRRPRVLRLYRSRHAPQTPSDPPHVKRIIIPNFAAFLDELDEEPAFEPPDIELAPQGDDD